MTEATAGGERRWAREEAFRGRITWLDVARGIAMLMVVSSHAIEWTESEPVSEVSAWVHVFNGSAQLPVFFCVSGILFARALNLEFRELWQRRVLPLLWVFVIWQPVVFAYKFAAGQFLPNQEDTSLAAHLVRLAASPLRPSGELWFLWALALFTLVAYSTRRLPAAVQLVIAGVLSAAWFSFAPIMLGADTVRLLGPGLNGLVSYYFFFLAGVIFATTWKRAAGFSAALHISVVAAWAAFVITCRLTSIGDAAGTLFALKVVGLFGCMSLAILLGRVMILERIGQASINIYLVHTTLIVGTLIALRTVAPVPWDWWGPILLLVGATVAGMLFYRLNQAGHLTWLTALPRKRQAAQQS